MVNGDGHWPTRCGPSLNGALWVKGTGSSSGPDKVQVTPDYFLGVSVCVVCVSGGNRQMGGYSGRVNRPATVVASGPETGVWRGDSFREYPLVTSKLPPYI